MKNMELFYEERISSTEPLIGGNRDGSIKCHVCRTEKAQQYVHFESGLNLPLCIKCIGEIQRMKIT